MEDVVYIPVETLAEWKWEELKRRYPDLREEVLKGDMKTWYKFEAEPKKLEPVYDDEGVCFGYM